MDEIKQAIEALEPLSKRHEAWSGSSTLEERVLQTYIELERAAEALAALHKLDAAIEQGFEEWVRHRLKDIPIPRTAWETDTWDRWVAASREGYRAGQIARIPAEIREALVEAWEEIAHAEDGERYAKARAWLESK